MRLLGAVAGAPGSVPLIATTRLFVQRPASLRIDKHLSACPNLDWNMRLEALSWITIPLVKKLPPSFLCERQYRAMWIENVRDRVAGIDARYYIL